MNEASPMGMASPDGSPFQWRCVKPSTLAQQIVLKGHHSLSFMADQHYA